MNRNTVKSKNVLTNDTDKKIVEDHFYEMLDHLLAIGLETYLKRKQQTDETQD